MSPPTHRLELLAPARDAEIGIEAVRHGADAVYIGGPAFGARAAAGNSVADIERLAEFAHRFSARVFVTLNTILRDDELEPAARMVRDVYAAGADALIVQDMALLELDLPPIALHASTQTDVRDIAKARFLAEVGFSQIVLARELELERIAEIAAGTDALLEFFIHGALCVSYSGQCYISHAHTGRSANRGECSQACRLPYTLSDGEGRVVARDRHLLSLKDNDQTANLQALVDVGIRSFKIEGRLKDLAYVKNITAHYRRELDRIIDRDPGLARGSAGRCRFRFDPDPAKTFNRGATDYFVNGRQPDIAAFDTPKFAGDALGVVMRSAPGEFDLMTPKPMHNGDGLSFFDAHGELVGLRVNRAEPVRGGWRLHVSDHAPRPPVGTEVHRNLDHAFERQLAGESAERRIAVRMHFAESAEGYRLRLVDEEGCVGEAQVAQRKDPARSPERAGTAIRDQLGRLGETIFELATPDAIELTTEGPRFLPAGVLNGLRRAAVDALEAARREAWQRPPRRPPVEPPVPCPEASLEFFGNVFNARARDFYARHGVNLIAAAYEANEEPGEVSLMVTRHCLRYSFHLCPKQVRGTVPEPMVLESAGDRLLLRFDCKRCEMHVIGRMRPEIARQPVVAPAASAPVSR